MATRELVERVGAFLKEVELSKQNFHQLKKKLQCIRRKTSFLRAKRLCDPNYFKPFQYPGVHSGS